MKKLKIKPVLLFSFAAILCFYMLGCAAIESVRDTSHTGQSGRTYYLPKGILRLTVIQEIDPPATLQQTSPYHTNSAITNQITFRQGNPNPGSLKYTANGMLDMLDLSGKGDVTNVITQVQSTTYDSNSGGGGGSVPGQSDKWQTNYYVSTSVDLVQDRDQRYMLSLKPSFMADDFMKIGVSNGFLQTLVLSNADQTLTVLSNLASAAVTLVQFVGMTASAGIQPVWTTNIYCFDPTTAGRDEVIKSLSERFGIRINLDDIPLAKPDSNNASADGIFYREPLTYYIHLEIPSGRIDSEQVSLPNDSPVDCLTFDRSAFVSQSYMLVIHDGLPYEIAMNKPSGAAALSSLPITIANDLMSIPLSVTNLLQLKFNIATGQGKLAQAQAGTVTNEMALIQANQQLANLLSSFATNSNSINGQVGQGKKP